MPDLGLDVFGGGPFGGGPFGDVVPWWPSGGDPLRTHRTEYGRVDLLTDDDANLGTLDGVAACTLDHKAGATIHGTGVLEIDDRGQDIDWLTMRVQPWWTVEGYGSWPLGVYLLASPVETHTDEGTRWRVELLDKLTVLDQDRVAYTYSLPAGTVVTDAVRDVIEGAGESAVAITDSTETLTTGMVWEAGTSRLRIVNDLLAAINYWALRCDRWGRYTASPYVRPQDRVPTWDLTSGRASIIAPEWTIDRDLVAVPNRVIIKARGSVDTEGLVGLAENTDPASPYSYQSRKDRWVTVVEDHEATSQGVVDAIAARRLGELSQVAAEYLVEHAMVEVDLHDVVTLDDGAASVQGWSVDVMEVGAQMRSTLREVSA